MGAKPMSVTRAVLTFALSGTLVLLLDVARDVAHGTERKATPIATFLLGAAVARRVAAGEERHAALSAVANDLRGVLPETQG